MVTIKGGDKLGAALSEIAKKFSDGGTLRVGFLENATYPDGTNVATVAVVQEFGSPDKGIPPRPFFRTMIAKNSPEWPKEIADNLKANGGDVKKALKQAGEAISSQLKQSIEDLTAPPLSPVTVMLRGMRRQKRYRDLPFGQRLAIAIDRVEAGKTNYGASTKPLIDTGVLIKAIDFEIKD